MSSERTIAYRCRYFRGDRPCDWHKQHGVTCECDYYEPIDRRLLIIKLDAMGDVLRTTCLLPPIKAAWPEYSITWITRPESVPLLQKNPLIDEIIPYGADALVQLGARRFHRVVNLDAGKTSASLASLAVADDKIGYLLHEDGYVVATNSAAEDWLRMGVFDDLKKINRRTYQDVMCAILGLPTDKLAYVLALTEEEINRAASRLTSMGVDFAKPIIGIHTGGGGRWRLKQWGEDSFLQLIRTIVRDFDAIQIVLFGGPLEGQANQRIVQAVGASARVFDTGCENPVRHFGALVAACDVMLSGDSLAMHVALAVGTRAVVLFGPTSHAEIELFDLGEKVIPDLDCLVCYKQECDFVPNCMDSISVDAVKEAVLRQLSLATASPGGRVARILPGAHRHV
jgi:lipopolysaccharide heptosyltransferase III